MDKRFINVEDQDVAVYYIYADASGFACSDSAATVKMTATQLRNVFYAGCVVVVSGVEYRPIHLKEAAGVVTLTYATTDTTPTAAKLATVKSVVDPA